VAKRLQIRNWTRYELHCVKIAGFEAALDAASMDEVFESNGKAKNMISKYRI
jgi:hypothetical protein